MKRAMHTLYVEQEWGSSCSTSAKPELRLFFEASMGPLCEWEQLQSYFPYVRKWFAYLLLAGHKVHCTPSIALTHKCTLCRDRTASLSTQHILLYCAAHAPRRQVLYYSIQQMVVHKHGQHVLYQWMHLWGHIDDTSRCAAMLHCDRTGESWLQFCINNRFDHIVTAAPLQSRVADYSALVVALLDIFPLLGQFVVDVAVSRHHLSEQHAD